MPAALYFTPDDDANRLLAHSPLATLIGMLLAQQVPANYTSAIGDYSHVVRVHTGNGPHEQVDGRAVAAFVLALDEVAIPDNPRLRFQLIAWFTWATVVLNRRWSAPRRCPRRPPPPRWDWEGTEGWQEADVPRAQRSPMLPGVDLGLYSAHGLRAGFVTYAHLMGQSDRAIARHTRHRSLASLGPYVRIQDAWTNNAAVELRT